MNDNNIKKHQRLVFVLSFIFILGAFILKYINSELIYRGTAIVKVGKIPQIKNDNGKEDEKMSKFNDNKNYKYDFEYVIDYVYKDIESQTDMSNYAGKEVSSVNIDFLTGYYHVNSHADNEEEVLALLAAAVDKILTRQNLIYNAYIQRVSDYYAYIESAVLDHKIFSGEPDVWGERLNRYMDLRQQRSQIELMILDEKIHPSEIILMPTKAERIRPVAMRYILLAPVVAFVFALLMLIMFRYIVELREQHSPGEGSAYK